jgi:hypothetical protein
LLVQNAAQSLSELVICEVTLKSTGDIEPGRGWSADANPEICVGWQRILRGKTVLANNEVHARSLVRCTVASVFEPPIGGKPLDGNDSRKSIERRRPPRLAGGINGAISAHSASVRSLG